MALGLAGTKGAAWRVARGRSAPELLTNDRLRNLAPSAARAPETPLR